MSKLQVHDADNTVERLFSFNKSASPEEGISKQFRDDLSKSHKAILILVFGSLRSGKSTLLNFLTVKGYPLLNTRRQIPPEAKEMMYFEAKGGSSPCTTDFIYKKIKLSEFKIMHCLKDIPAGSDDYDIFFIDSGGFGGISDVQNDLFLGIFSLLSSISVQIYFGGTSMLNTDRTKDLSQFIALSSFLKIKFPKTTISIAKSSITVDCDDDDDDDDVEDDDIKYNDRLYDVIKKKDKKDKSVFINALKEKVVINKENNIFNLTMPICDKMHGIAYKKVLNDLTKIIVENTVDVPYSGKYLLGKIDESYSKIVVYKDLFYGKSIDAVYSTLFKEFCSKMDKEGKEMEKEIIISGGCKKDNFVWEYLLRKLREIIPNLDSLDEVTKGFLMSFKK